VPVGVAYVTSEEKVRLFESRCGLCGKSLWSQANATAFCDCMCFDAGDRHKSSLWRLSRMKCPQGVVMVVGEFAV